MKKNTYILILLISMLNPVCSQDAYSAITKETILRITSIFENGTTDLQYGYAENIQDGRGITFGFFGLTTGTYDGTLFMKKYQILNNENILIKYIDAFIQIDSQYHNEEGITDCIDGLDYFIDDFKKCISDPCFSTAQNEICDELYWNPAVEIFSELKLQLPITLGQLYDTCIQHGVEGCLKIVELTNSKQRNIGTIEEEKKWLEIFLEIRTRILKNSDDVWKESADRVVCYKRMLKTGNIKLKLPIELSVFGDEYNIE